MFDLGFWELFLCAVIALVVLGPERLPGVARALGRWTGQARAYMRNLTAELDRELKVREVQEQIRNADRAVRDQSAAATDAVRKLGQAPQTLKDEMKDEMTPLPPAGRADSTGRDET